MPDTDIFVPDTDLEGARTGAFSDILNEQKRKLRFDQIVKDAQRELSAPLAQGSVLSGVVQGAGDLATGVVQGAENLAGGALTTAGDVLGGALTTLQRPAQVMRAGAVPTPPVSPLDQMTDAATAIQPFGAITRGVERIGQGFAQQQQATPEAGVASNLGTAMDASQGGYRKMQADLVENDPTGGYAAGAANVATDLVSDPLTLAGGIGGLGGKVGVATTVGGGVAGGLVAGATPTLRRPGEADADLEDRSRQHVAESIGAGAGIGALAGGAVQLGHSIPAVRDRVASLSQPVQDFVHSMLPELREPGGAGAAARRIGSQVADAGPARASLGIVPPGVARRQPGGVRVPEDPILAQAVANTRGAEITPDGLAIDVKRFQQAAQADEESVRTGVFYLPGDAKSAGYSTAKYGYGGPEEIAGPTILRQPLVVKGATGGRAPEIAYDHVNGKGAYEAMRRKALAALPSYGSRAGVGEQANRVSTFLQVHGFEADEADNLAYTMLDTQKGGNKLPYAMQEAVVAQSVRGAGYDSVVGYSTTSKGPRLSEVFDLRESHYPTPDGGYTLRPEFQPPEAAQGAVRRQPAGIPEVAMSSGLPPATDLKMAPGGDRYVGYPSGVNSPETLDGLRVSLDAMAREGEPGRFWYDRSSEAILQMFGGDKDQAEKFVQLLAIYSPKNAVGSNTTNALRVWSQFLANPDNPAVIQGGHFGHADEAARQLLYYDKPWEGAKTNNFYRNLMLKIDPEKALAQDSQLKATGVTIDRWMMRALGYVGDEGKEANTAGSYTDAQYRAASQEVIGLANKLGWGPEQVQAAIWVSAKTRSDLGKMTAKAAPGKVLPSVEEMIRGSSYDFSNALTERNAQVSWEAAPGRTSGVLPGYHDATPIRQAEFHQAVAGAFTDENGHDIAARTLGVPHGGTFDAPGVFEGAVNPGSQIQIPIAGRQVSVGGVKQAGAATQLEPSAKAAIDGYAALRGLVTKQDAMAWTRPFFNSSAAEANGTAFRIGRSLTREETIQLDRMLTERLGPGNVAVVGSPDGAWLLNTSAYGDAPIANDVFHKGVLGVAGEFGNADTSVELGRFASDGGYLSNDWRTHPNGEGYRQGIAAAGRPDLYRQLEDVLAARVSAVHREYAAKYGWDQAGAASTDAGRAPGAASPVSEGAAGVRSTPFGRLGLPQASNVAGATVGGLAGAAAGEEDDTLNQRAQRVVGGAVLGGLGVTAARGLARGGRAALPTVADEQLGIRLGGRPTAAPSTDPIIKRVEDMYQQSSAKPSVGLTPRLQAIKQTIVTQLFDRDAPLHDLENKAVRALGRTLGPDEQASLQRAMNPGGRAQIDVQEHLRPAVQSVGEDVGKLEAYLTFKNNVEVAKAMGERAEAAAAPGAAAASRWTAPLESAKENLRQIQEMAQNDPATLGIKEEMQKARAQVKSLQTRVAKDIQADIVRVEGGTMEARARGAQVVADRKFSGGLTSADSAAALTRLEAELGPDRFAKVEASAQQVYTLSNKLLDDAEAAGRISPELHQELTTKYPSWVKTQILDYLDDPARISLGKGLSLRDQGLKSYTEAGTDKLRETPLASMVRHAYQSRALDQKNIAFNALLKMRNGMPNPDDIARAVPDSYKAKRGEGILTGFVGGVRETYAVDGDVARAITNEALTPIPVLGTLMNVWKSLVTSRNPVFLGANAAIDAATYTLRTLSREGGNPLKIPGIVGDLVGAYADSFKGLASGEFKGKAADFYKAGGAFGGFFQNETGPKTVEALARRSAFEVNSLGDLKRIAGQLITLAPVEAVGSRIELAPRVAAFNRATRQGKSTQEAARAGQTVTIDFNQGGYLAKSLNQLIPFFNVGMQGVAQPLRAARENPKGFALTVGTSLAVPVAFEQAWNTADPQRAKDYDQVPDQYKSQGLVYMLPEGASLTGTYAPKDEFGDRRPQFVHVRLREFAPIAQALRQATRVVMGEKPQDWDKFAGDLVGAASPIQAHGVADAANSFLPLGIKTAVQLERNEDSFRQSPIATEQNDERATALGKAGAALTGVRPSQVDFAVRDAGGGVGAMVSSGVDAGAEALGLVGKKPGEVQEPETPQDIPVVGSLVGRFVRSARKGVPGALVEKYDLSEKDADKVLTILGQAAQVRQKSLPQMDKLAAKVGTGDVTGAQFRLAWKDLGKQTRGFVEASGKLLPPTLQAALEQGIAPDEKLALDELKGKAVDPSARALMDYQRLGDAATDENGLFDGARYASARRGFLAGLSPTQRAYIDQHRLDYITRPDGMGRSIEGVHPELGKTLREMEQAREMMGTLYDTPKYRGMTADQSEAVDGVLAKLDDVSKERPALAEMDRADRLLYLARRTKAAGNPIEPETLRAARKVLMLGADAVSPARERIKRQPGWAVVRKYYGDLDAGEIAAVAARSA